MSPEGEGGTPRLNPILSRPTGRVTVQNPLSSLDVPAAVTEPPLSVPCEIGF